jgi:hypothetical protein
VEPDNDPLAPLVALLIVGTLAACAVLFVVLAGGMAEPSKVWGVVRTVAPWYAGLAATLLIARWLGRRRKKT